MMHVKTLDFPKFYKWKGASMVMGEGLTFVVGKNGTGKSSLGVESFSWIIWGKLVRGGKAKGFAATGVFQLVDKTYRIRRDDGLMFEQLNADGDVPLVGQTPTQTQEKINELFGSWDTFVATHVFSGQRAKTFGGSTNASRQEILLDLVPELSRFDQASDLAKAKVREEEGKLQGVHVASERAQGVLAEVKTQVEEAKAKPVDVSAAREMMVTTEKLQTQLDAQVTEFEGKEDRLRKLHKEASLDWAASQKTSGELGAAYRQAKDIETRMRSLAAECPSCYQKVPDEHRANVLTELQTTVHIAQTALDEIEAQVKMLASEAGDAQDAVSKAVNRVRGARSHATEVGNELARAAAAVKEAQDNQRDLERVQGRVAELQKDADGKSDKEAIVTQALIRARAVAEVLGPKGVRVQLMQSQLQFLTEAACEVLMSLGSGIRVELSTSKAKKGGGAGAPQVHVKVTIDGTSFEYVELSAGERVRLDVAFLLALAKLAGPGLLVFDEVFDPLDDEGLEGVANLLQEMARDRQIVVVSHNPRLASLMPRGAVWRVEREPGGHSQLHVG